MLVGDGAVVDQDADGGRQAAEFSSSRPLKVFIAFAVIAASLFNPLNHRFHHWLYLRDIGPDKFASAPCPRTHQSIWAKR